MIPNSKLFHLLVITNRHVIPHWKASPTGQSIESTVESYSQIGREINSPCTCGPLAPLSGCAATQARSSTLGCVAFRWPPGRPPARRAAAPPHTLRPRFGLPSATAGAAGIGGLRWGLRTLAGRIRLRPQSACNGPTSTKKAQLSYCVEVGPVFFYLL
jgi:hypothetical protein